MDAVGITRAGLNALGEKLREYRERRGWSQREAARYLARQVPPGLGATALGRIEQGRAKVSMETLLMLSQIGYGDLSFLEMVDIATERRLVLCERVGGYRVDG